MQILLKSGSIANVAQSDNCVLSGARNALETPNLNQGYRQIFQVSVGHFLVKIPFKGLSVQIRDKIETSKELSSVQVYLLHSFLHRVRLMI